MAEESVLKFENVTLVYHNKAVLSEISFKVCAGEHWVVLGPNGAGKSSLLQIAAARLRPTSGSATILGEALGSIDMRLLRQRIGISSSFIYDQLRGDLLVEEVVLTGMYGDLAPWWRLYTGSEREKARDLLRLAGLEVLSHRPMFSLSAGERQQMMIARALMPQPSILLLDEPTSALDMGARERFLDRLDALLAEHPTLALIMITHRLEDVPQSTTHGLLLRQGIASAAGSAADVLTDPLLSSAFDTPLRVERIGGRYRGALQRSVQAV